MIAYAAIALLVLILAGLYVGPGLAILGLLLQQQYAFIPLVSAIGDIAWSSSTDFILVSLPLFILMGEILVRSGISDRMFKAIDPWVSWLPGGLMHTNIGSAAIFSATSGSSVATAATIATVSLPVMRRNGYNQRLFLGSIAAGGTLGILIPPSINMVVYAMLAKASLGTLYISAIVPGIILTGLFSLIIAVSCMLRPAWAGRVERRPTWRDRAAQLPHLLPPLAIFAVVIAPIYLGWATPTECAALGVLASLLLGVVGGKFGRRELLGALEGTMRTTCMVMIIVLGALFLNFVMVTIGLTNAITGGLLGLGLSPVVLILAIIAFYFVLGCVMETLSMMIATTPIIVPIVVGLGYSEVWWGVVFVLLMEAALITPPIGLNLFVVQSIRREGGLADVAIGATPFLLAIILLIGLLLAFPEIALWLPQSMK